MTVDECVKLLEELVPSECTDTYEFNGCLYLVRGKVNREAIEDLEAMDPSYVATTLAVAMSSLKFQGWLNK